MTSIKTNGNTCEFVTAEVKYLADTENLAVYIASTGGGDSTEHQGKYLMQKVRIQNGREHVPEFSLDREGFILTGQISKVRDFYSDLEIEDVYESEVERLVLEATGGKQVEIFDHTRRSSSLQVQKEHQIREAASIIHNDYTDRSGSVRLKDYFAGTPERADVLLQNRFAIINVWRSIAGRVLQSPLAFCDASSVQAGDLVRVERKAKERIGEIQLALYNPDHRWYYFPEMKSSEALLFKTFDSATDGRSRFTIHTSFEDPEAPVDAPPRESIETRCFVFF